jgi:hypothetical protein
MSNVEVQSSNEIQNPNDRKHFDISSFVIVIDLTLTHFQFVTSCEL